jgi:hypothetical protein
MSAVALPPLDEDAFAVETAEMRYARRHGDTSLPAGHDDPAPQTYGMGEGVWRPDGRGANDTIYKPFYWKGRKVRALKPAPKQVRGEQWSFPGRANNDHQIGILTGDARFIGNERVVLGGDRRHFNRFQALQRHSRSAGVGTGGAVGEELYGTGEAQGTPGMRRDAVLEALANQEGTNPSQARPLPFLRKAIEQQVASALEAVVEEDRVKGFLLDPDANEEYNTLAMGASVRQVNDTGDFNLGADANLGRDRGMAALGVGIRRLGQARAGASMSGADAPQLMSDTMNAVRIRTADMQGVNTWGAADGVAADQDVQRGDDVASAQLTHVKDQSSTTKVLFGRSSRGTVDSSADGMGQEQAPLSAARRYKRKELDQGAYHVSSTSADQDAGDKAPLSAARRTKRKELDQGGYHVSSTSADQDGGDKAPLSAARRYKRKEQDQGGYHVSSTSADQDGGDKAPLSAARRLKRKEQDQGRYHAGPTSAADLDAGDKAPLSSARRLKRKEQDAFDGWNGTEGLDTGDWTHRDAVPRKREADTSRRNAAAMLPGAGYDNAGDVMGVDRPVLMQVPSQEARGRARAAARSSFGVGAMGATETAQYAAQSRIDPAQTETLSRSTLQVNLRDRRTQQTPIGLRGYDEMAALESAYRQNTAWIARGRGKLSHGVTYESGAESSGGEE